MGDCWCGFDIVGNLNGWDPVHRDERTYAFSGNLTKLKGAHEFRVGYSVNKLQLEPLAAGTRLRPARRSLFAATNSTALNGGAQDPNIYNIHAAFLLGLMSYAANSVQNELMTTREWQHNFYGRDRWQVNDKLTLDLGLRYEYYPLMTRKDRGIEQVVGANDLRERSRAHAARTWRSAGSAATRRTSASR